MYLWLFIVVGLVWLWLVGGSLYAWRQHRLHGFWSLASIGACTGIAAAVILFGGPYWEVVYRVFGQPG